MGIGVSILLVAAGAILLWGVEGVNTIGWILLLVGAVGGLISLAFWSSWGGFGHRERIIERR